MKTRFMSEWLRTPEAKALSASTRELVREILDIAGTQHHRYTTDQRRCVAVVWAGQRNVAERLGLTVNGVKQRMRVATRAGLIARTRRAFGGSSITVLELTLPMPTPEDVPNAGQADGSGSRREIEFAPTVGQSSLPQSDRGTPDISDAVGNRSAVNASCHHHTDFSVKGLSPSSGDKDTAAPTAPSEPTLASKNNVRDALCKLGVTPNAVVTMQRDIDHHILAAIVVVMINVKRQRPKSPQARDPKAMGAWIGSILFKGTMLDAWIRTLLEDDAVGERALEVLDEAGMIAEQEYPD